MGPIWRYPNRPKSYLFDFRLRAHYILRVLISAVLAIIGCIYKLGYWLQSTLGDRVRGQYHIYESYICCYTCVNALYGLARVLSARILASGRCYAFTGQISRSPYQLTNFQGSTMIWSMFSCNIGHNVSTYQVRTSSDPYVTVNASTQTHYGQFSH
jgi:hypothetical protein